MKCIYCNKIAEPSIEHIIPESLGCPESAVFTHGEVCKKCNNRLGSKIDQYLINDLEFIGLSRGVPRKGNRPPVITNKGNVTAKIIDGKQNLFVNMSREAIVTPFGDKVAGYDKTKKSHIKLKTTVNTETNEATINFSHEFGNDKRFTRALYKIGFEAFVLQMGVEEGYREKYKHIKDYIVKGIGEKFCIGVDTKDKREYNVLYPCYSKNDEFIVPIKICTIDFIIDLSPDQQLSRDVIEEFKKAGKTGWTIMPYYTKV